MKAKRKLFSAIVLLVVSVMMLSTASYAWFSTNKDVTVSGLQIEAKAPTNLFIKGVGTEVSGVPKWTNAGVSFDAATKMGNQQKLNPTVTALEGGTREWYTGSSDDPDAVGTRGGKLAGITTENYFGKYEDTDHNVEYYYFALTYNFYAKSEMQCNLYISEFTTDETVSKLGESLRLLAVGTAAGKTTGSVEIDIKGTKPVGATGAQTFKDFSLIKNLAHEDTSTESVTIYIFFNGDHAECKTSNITTTLSKVVSGIKIKFALEETTTAYTDPS